MKKIGVLTSGGDSQGMNAAVYATVRYAIDAGLKVYGIKNGYQGLIDGEVVQLTARDVENIAHRGGTVLGTARCLDMKTPEGQAKAVATLKKHGIEGLVVIGGDGSFAGAKVLSTQYGIKTVGIPGTIDNDLAYTDFTLGFDSAVTVVVNAVKGLRDTMSCNGRSCVVEVMGRDCGDIALYAALATGAEAIVVPELGYDRDKIADRIEHNVKVGKLDNIVIVSEGIRSDGTLDKGKEADKVAADLLKRMPNLNIRTMVVGHLQRSGDATAQDTLLGIRMGAHAVNCLVSGKTNRVIGIHNDQIFDEDIVEALAKTRTFDTVTYELADKLSKY
ncbi:MAG: 6-phosphofructokinase [Clostridiales bacterium]|nr:6-phosphofructokinase [Clostridiales bacterium]